MKYIAFQPSRVPVIIAALLTLSASGLAGEMDLLPYRDAGGWIRADQPDERPGASTIIFGAIDEQHAARGVMAIDLSSLPSASQITTASLTFTIHTRDSETRNGGLKTIELRQIHVIPSHYATWLQATSEHPWQTPGGDMQAQPFASFQADPTKVRGGDTITIQTPRLLEMVKVARQLDAPFLCFMLISPDLEAQSHESGRGLFRIQGPRSGERPVLTVTYDDAAEPS